MLLGTYAIVALLSWPVRAVNTYLLLLPTLPSQQHNKQKEHTKRHNTCVRTCVCCFQIVFIVALSLPNLYIAMCSFEYNVVITKNVALKWYYRE